MTVNRFQDGAFGEVEDIALSPATGFGDSASVLVKRPDGTWEKIWPAGAVDQFVYDFETGDVSRWDDVNDLTAVSDRVFNGNFSGFTDTAQQDTFQARGVPDGYAGGAQPSEFTFYWQEKSESFGGGIRLLNSNGDVEVGLATDNPEWVIDDANGDVQVEEGDEQYELWARFTITFDWVAGTFDADFEDLDTGNTFVDSGRPLKQGVDIETVQIEDFSDAEWGHGGSIEMWFDDITLTE